MKNNKITKILAIDLGASSGRGIIITYNGDTADTEEVYRFKNEPVTLNGHMYWDFHRIMHEIKNCLTFCANNGHGDIASIGIDTWGVDFGLLDKDGDLIGMPYHYRDTRVNGVEEKLEEKVGLRNLFGMSGIQNIWFNTSYQLYAMAEAKPEILAQARTFLLIPDLITYFLTGKKVNEFTAAATTQLYDFGNGRFSEKILNALGLPTGIFPETVYSSTKVGDLLDEIADSCGLRHGIPVIATACHDTAAAVTAVPADDDNFVFISCGTWSLLGTVIEKPIMTDESFRLGFSNEGMPEGKIKFLKNIMGLWIIQECRNYWLSRGENCSFNDLEAESKNSKPFMSFIDVEDECFANPSNMPEAITEYCRRTGQHVPGNRGELLRCAYESLAMKYRYAIEKTEEVTGKSFSCVNIIGGGCRDGLLCQFTAESTGKKVIAGPVEATAVGNGINQLIGLSEIKNVAEGRKVVKRSVNVSEYLPTDKAAWDKAYISYLEAIAKA